MTSPHDPEVCGINPHTDCDACRAEADTLERWPHLARPGPQPRNQIPGTLEECLALARTPRPSASELAARQLVEVIRSHREITAPILMDLLGDLITDLINIIITEVQGDAE